MNLRGVPRSIAGSPALTAWVTARIVVLAALGLAAFIAEELGARSPTGREPGGLLAFDGAWYERIASEGYTNVPEEALRFFPLFPLLGRAVGLLVGGQDGVGLLLVANVAALITGLLIERLAVRETGDPDIGARAAWFVAIAPPAFVLVMGYSEAMFMATVAGTFLALRSGRWWAAAGLGAAAALTRPIGLLVMVPAVIEAARGGIPGGWRPRVARTAAVFAPAAGLVAYLGWVGARFGDPLLPFEVQQQGNLRGGFANPIETMGRALRGLTDGDLVGSGFHVVWIAGFVVLLVVAFRRWPASYGAFATAVLLAAVSAQNLNSVERYAFSAIPFVLAATTVTQRPLVERGAIAAGAAGLLGYATLSFLAAYVP